LAIVCASGAAMADPQAQIQVQTAQPNALKVKFVPPPELGAKPNRPGPSADGAYTLQVTVRGIHAQTKQPWTISVPARSYSIVSPRDAASGLPTGKRMHKPIRFTFHKSALQDGVLPAALARQDGIASVSFAFRPVAQGAPQYITAHELGHASLEVVDEYVEVAFPTFQKITWTWNDGPKAVTDEWIVPPR
jgi:type VI secretion system secreted protein Hcp